MSPEGRWIHVAAVQVGGVGGVNGPRAADRRPDMFYIQSEIKRQTSLNLPAGRQSEHLSVRCQCQHVFT